MIQICDKHNCCGCLSCVQRCPKHCITVQQDSEGFFFPWVAKENCIDCGLCETVCPFLSRKQGNDVQRVFAAKNPDEDIRKDSSSGGVFAILAEKVIQAGGVVFGARWTKDWNVEHDYAATIEKLQVFRSSKYVQSCINVSYQQAEAFLKEGRKVLFSGTPCQIAGLKTFLCEEYDNLITIECACHGVPSPGLWRQYLEEVSKRRPIIAISHRDKRIGWRNYCLVIKFADGKEIVQPHDNNPWTRAFIKSLDLRPSCYQCAFKGPNSQADITLADLWGDRILLKNQDEDKGISLVIVHSSKGKNIVADIDSVKDFTLEEIVPFNEALVISPREDSKRGEFMNGIQKGRSFIGMVKILAKDPLTLRAKHFIRGLIR